MKNTIKTFKDLEVWKESRVLVKQVYLLTQLFPDSEKFGLTIQMRRCAVSIISNIAEGMGRNSLKETIQFLHIARGSIYELETQLIIGNDLGFYGIAESQSILDQLDLVQKLLFGFLKHINNKLLNTT